MAHDHAEIVRSYFEDVLVEDRFVARIAELWEPDGDYYPVGRSLKIVSSPSRG